MSFHIHHFVSTKKKIIYHLVQIMLSNTIS